MIVVLALMSSPAAKFQKDFFLSSSIHLKFIRLQKKEYDLDKYRKQMINYSLIVNEMKLKSSPEFQK